MSLNPPQPARRRAAGEARADRSARRVDGEQSRTRILEAAERLLAERGYSGTGISAISRESGLPASSIYWFFESKRDLAAAVVESAAARWLDALEGAEEIDLAGLMAAASAQSGDRLPDFMRLEVLLALERSEADEALIERLRSVRERARDIVGRALRRTLADTGRATASAELIDEIAESAMGFASGALISRHIDDRATTHDFAGDLTAAVLAVYDRRLEAH